VILRFAPEKDLLLSGMIVSGGEIAEKTRGGRCLAGQRTRRVIRNKPDVA